MDYLAELESALQADGPVRVILMLTLEMWTINSRTRDQVDEILFDVVCRYNLLCGQTCQLRLITLIPMVHTTEL